MNYHPGMAPAPATPEHPDAVDDVVGAWRRVRPDLDLEAIEAAGRLGRIALLLGPAQNELLAGFDLQNGGFDVLSSLRRAGPPYTLTPSTLADRLLLSRAGMTSRVDRLERSGFVERSLDPEDRRSFRIRLTDAGLEVVDRAMTAHTANVTALLGAVDADGLAHLNELLRTLLRGLAREDGPPVSAPRRR